MTNFITVTLFFLIEETDPDEEVPDMAEFEGQEDDKENGQVRQNSVHLS